MRKLLPFLLLLAALPVHAVTHYIRTDGGTSVQCDGTTNHALSGATSNHCGLIHPYYLTTDNLSGAAFSWSFVNTFGVGFAGGDTIQFVDSGPYYYGLQNGGLGINWSTCAGDPFDCDLPPLPSGSSGNTTKVYGVCMLTTCVSGSSLVTNSTSILGINNIFIFFNTTGSAFWEIKGLDISQPDTCTYQGTGAGHCVSGSNAGNIGILLNYQTGAGATNYTVQYNRIHGLGGDGIKGSHSAGVWTVDSNIIQGNGHAGWDWDGGGCGTSCESTGTGNITNNHMNFDGCNEVKPNGGYNATTGTANNGYNYCFGQSATGYGDELAVIAAGDITLNVLHNDIRWGVQDCYDLLHLGDDPTHVQVLNVKNNWAEGCGGQMFKLGGVADVHAWSNHANSNCHVLLKTNVFPMTLNPSGYEAGITADTCRAGGDQWAIAINDGHVVELINNTTTGYGSTMYDVSCSNSCTGTEGFVFQNNISKGYGDPDNANTPPGGFFFSTPDPFGNPGSAATNNLWNTMRSGTCPQSSFETAYQCGDPLMVAESDINFIDPRLTAPSPAIAAGITIGPTVDYYGNPFLTPRVIGFAQFGTPPPPTGTKVQFNRVIINGIKVTP